MSLAALLDEPELNEFQKAFYSGNVSEMKSVCEQFKTPKEQIVFKIIDEIMFGKRRMLVDDIPEYDQCLINNALSQHVDLAYYASVMNSMIDPDRVEHISNQMHFDYLWVSVRRAKRPKTKWAKMSTSEDKLLIACISELYDLSERKAIEYFREFPPEIIEHIKKKSKAFAMNETFLKRKFNIPNNLIAELQSMVNKW